MKENFTPQDNLDSKSSSNLTQRPAEEVFDQFSDQDQPTWPLYDKIDENFVRLAPSPEAVKKMDGRLEGLGKLFTDSDIHWQIDGALNISLLNGAGENPQKYIGEHKDVDISVDEEDLSTLEEHLLKNGYALFLSRSGADGKKTMRRASYRDLVETRQEHPLIVAIDEAGRALDGVDLNYIDIHIVKHDEEGRVLGRGGTPLPDKWSHVQAMDFHGETINISHPGRVLYHKLHEGRNYDFTDVDSLVNTGKISEEDLDDVERVIEDEFQATVSFARKILEEVSGHFKPDMLANDIFVVLQQNSDLKNRVKDEAVLRKWAEKIAAEDDKSVDHILDISMNFFGIKEKKDKKIFELFKMREKLKDFRNLENLRQQL